MGLLPTIKKLSTEDYPTEVRTWIGTLFYPLNELLTTIYQNLNNGLTFGQNMLAQVKTLAIPASAPVSTFPYNYAPQIPIGMMVIKAINAANSTAIQSSAIGCTWVINSGNITVTVQGIPSGQTYNITFLVIGG